MSKLEYMQDLERQLSEAQQHIFKLGAENERLRDGVYRVQPYDNYPGLTFAAWGAGLEAARDALLKAIAHYADEHHDVNLRAHVAAALKAAVLKRTREAGEE